MTTISPAERASLSVRLEAMVDAHDLLHVLTALEFICSEKALLVSQADMPAAKRNDLARVWRKCATACKNAAIVSAELP